MTENQIEEQIKRLILDTINKQKPDTSEQLIALMQEGNKIQPEKTRKILLELERENLLQFKRCEQPTINLMKGYLFSPKARLVLDYTCVLHKYNNYCFYNF